MFKYNIILFHFDYFTIIQLSLILLVNIISFHFEYSNHYLINLISTSYSKLFTKLHINCLASNKLEYQHFHGICVGSCMLKVRPLDPTESGWILKGHSVKAFWPISAWFIIDWLVFEVLFCLFLKSFAKTCVAFLYQY